MPGRDEKQFILQGFHESLRCDGRGCTDTRPIVISVGDMQQCSGSARCSLGSTAVVVGVKVRQNAAKG
jgi:exosome complex RNA-binding protein Rrp42 (RNase PH superfamily)